MSNRSRIVSAKAIIALLLLPFVYVLFGLTAASRWPPGQWDDLRTPITALCGVLSFACLASLVLARNWIEKLIMTVVATLYGAMACCLVGVAVDNKIRINNYIPEYVIERNNVNAEAVPKRVIRTYRIGKIHGKKMLARILFKGMEDGQYGEFYVQYCSFCGGRWNVQAVVDIDTGFVSDVKIKVADFIGEGHKQVFVETSMERITTDILDWNGKRVRYLYKNRGGRVYADIKRSREHRYIVTELWSKWVMRDYDNLGEAVSVDEYSAVRTLHWNGRAFVPIHPGRTRIVSASRHRNRRH